MATPPLEALKLLLAKGAMGQRRYRPLRLAVIDARRADFYAKARRPIYVETPPEDFCDGDEHRVAELEMSLYGTRDAGLNWSKEAESVMPQLQFKKGEASTFCHRHSGPGSDITAHGDDFLVVAAKEDLHWLIAEMHKKFEIKADILGPEATMKQEVTFLNRRLSWGKMASNTRLTASMSMSS